MSESPDYTEQALAPPSWLTGTARQWWLDMVAEYEGFETEPHSRAILTEAATQMLRLEGYRSALADTGPTSRDRFGQLKDSPAAVGERAAANSLRLLCRELGLAPATEDHRPPRIGG